MDFLRLEHVFDRVLDREDVPLRHLVAEVEHRGQRRGLAGARRADDQDQPALFHHQRGEHVGQRQRPERRDVRRDVAHDDSDRALLPEHVHAEVAVLGDRLREVELPVVLEVLDLLRGEHLVGDLLRGLRVHHLRVHRHGGAVDLDVDRRAGRDEDVRGLALGHDLEQLVDEHGVFPGCANQSPRSNSLIEVLARVCAVDLLDDHRAVKAIPPVGGGQVARDHHRSGRDAPVAHLPRGAVVDLGALAEVDAHRDHRALADDHAFDDFAPCADEAVVLDDGGIRLHGLEHPADAHAARKMDVLADLRAGADRRPGVHHRALVDVGADVHVGGHQHDVPRDEGAMARHGGRHHAIAAGGKVLLGEVGELGIDLVEIVREAALHDPVVAQAE